MICDNFNAKKSWGQITECHMFLPNTVYIFLEILKSLSGRKISFGKIKNLLKLWVDLTAQIK